MVFLQLTSTNLIPVLFDAYCIQVYLIQIVGEGNHILYIKRSIIYKYIIL